MIKNIRRGFFWIIILVINIILTFSIWLSCTFILNTYLSTIIAVGVSFILIRFLFKRYCKKYDFPNVNKSSLIRAGSIAGITILVMGYIYWIPAVTKPQTPSPIEPYMLSLSDGNKLAVYTSKPESNESNNIPIVFVAGGPGFGPSPFDFLNKITKESGTYLYSYDTPGFRNSPIIKDNKGYTVDNELKRLSEVIDYVMKERGVKQVYLMGHSYGGCIVPRYIEKHGEQIAGYIAIDTAPIYTMSGNNKKQADEEARASSQSSGSLFSRNESIGQNIKCITGFFVGNLFNNFGTICTNDEMNFFFMSLAGLVDMKQDTISMPYFRSVVLINKDLNKSPDYSLELASKKSINPPVLLFHPENGVVPWQAHYQLKDYFDKVYFVPLADSVHSAWKNPKSADIMAKDITLFMNSKIEESKDLYKLSTDPFGKK